MGQGMVLFINIKLSKSLLPLQQQTSTRHSGSQIWACTVMRSLVSFANNRFLSTILTSKMQFLSVALAAGLSVAMPYTIQFPSITIVLHPTFSSTIVNNTMKPTTSSSTKPQA
jgi:hypothetical protein